MLIIYDDRVKEAFDFLNQYPRTENYLEKDEDGEYKCESFRTKGSLTVGEAIAETLEWASSIISKSEKIWLRIFPELTCHEGKFFLRTRITHKDNTFIKIHKKSYQELRQFAKKLTESHSVQVCGCGECIVMTKELRDVFVKAVGDM